MGENKWDIATLEESLTSEWPAEVEADRDGAFEFSRGAHYSLKPYQRSKRPKGSTSYEFVARGMDGLGWGGDLGESTGFSTFESATIL